MTAEWQQLGAAWGLGDNVIKVLKTEKCLSKEAMLLLSETDIASFGLKRGDLVKLRAAVRAYQETCGGGPLTAGSATPTASGTATTTTGGPGDDAGHLLHELLQPQGPSVVATTPVTDTMARLDLNPQYYLQRPRAGENKPLLITDYISHAAQECEEIELANGATLRLTSGTSKPKLSSVSPAQWIAANARILAELMGRGEVKDGGVQDYLAYTVKVGELACRYTWASVLTYDNEYRTRQAAFKFRWASDSQHLSTVMLREKGAAQATTSARQAGSDPKGGRRRGPNGKEVCLQYNSSRGCQYGAKCNYEHVCAVCSGDHPRADHKQPGTADSGKKD